jgi:hypothetical protein
MSAIITGLALRTVALLTLNALALHNKIAETTTANISIEYFYLSIDWLCNFSGVPLTTRQQKEQFKIPSLHPEQGRNFTERMVAYCTYSKLL